MAALIVELFTNVWSIIVKFILLFVTSEPVFAFMCICDLYLYLSRFEWLAFLLLQTNKFSFRNDIKENL